MKNPTPTTAPTELLQISPFFAPQVFMCTDTTQLGLSHLPLISPPLLRSLGPGLVAGPGSCSYMNARHHSHSCALSMCTHSELVLQLSPCMLPACHLSSAPTDMCVPVAKSTATRAHWPISCHWPAPWDSSEARPSSCVPENPSLTSSTSLHCSCGKT